MIIINITVKDITLEVVVIIKKQNRRAYYRIKPNNILQITTPYKISDEHIKKVILDNYEKIKKSLNTSNIEKRNSLHLFGKSYNLEIIESKHYNSYVLDDTIYIYCNLDNASKAIDKFYADKLKEYVEKRIDFIKRQFHIDYEITFKYKNVKTYFGECFYKRRLVILSTKLCKYEEIYIDSVIYHELAHFTFQNHSDSFYMLLEGLFPNYKRIQAKLRKIKFDDIY
ncbi:MAG: DUF45 domain-containing protein [Acholeplasmatales bacterium]|nr:DUF45 domain-containing protein [Acholeplasmatales bacterium]